MKKNDYILLAVILAIAAASLFIYQYTGNGQDGFVRVTVNGDLYGTYSLDDEHEVLIGDSVRLMISDGCADVVEALCPDQICVKQKAISKGGESIICLPNQVMIEIIGAKEAELDAVAK